MSELRNIVAERLKQCRQHKGWTHKETAQQLSAMSGESMTSSSYSNWELALRMPAPERIIQLAQLFGKPPAWLQGFTSNDSMNIVSTSYVTANSPNISTKAGLLTVTQATDSTAYHLDYLAQRGLDKNKLLSIKQLDNSMLPTIEEGAEVLLDRASIEVRGADLFGFVVNGNIWVRWIKPDIDGTFILAAEALDQYPEKKLTREELDALDIVGRVARIATDR